MDILDCRGLKCPQPVINTKRFFDGKSEGEAEVIVDNLVAKENISKFAASIGATATFLEKDGNYHLIIKKLCEACKAMDFAEKKTLTIVVSNNELGLGDPKLGATLMKSYLFALSEAEIVPDSLLFLNAGVKLTVEGSESLPVLEVLKSKGTTIMSCGTCLDFYGLKDKLAIGEITNMYAIVEKMNGSDKTIKL